MATGISRVNIGFPVFAQVTRSGVVRNSPGSAHAHSDLVDRQDESVALYILNRLE